MKLWARVLAVVGISILGFGLYINSAADELVKVACLSRPEALRLAFSMTIHNQHNLALPMRTGPCP